MIARDDLKDGDAIAALGIELQIVCDWRILQILHSWRLVPKGWTASELLSHPDRLTTPLIRERRGESLRAATWEEALDRIVGRRI
jgi:hypothetical protein